MTPEVILWRSVICQAITDALGCFPEPSYSNKYSKNDAVQWMDGEDITLVADYADTTPDFIRYIYNQLKSRKYYTFSQMDKILHYVFTEPRPITIQDREENQ